MRFPARRTALPVLPAEKPRLLTTAAALSLVGLLAVGCTSGGGDTPDTGRKTSPRSSPSPAQAPPSDRAEHAPGVSVTRAPVLPDAEVVAQAVNARGNRQLDVEGGLESGPLSILVNCRGKGRLTVLVEPAGLGFPLNCGPGEVSSTYDQLDLQAAHGRATVSVTAPSSVRWALTVGRRPHRDRRG